MKRSAVKLELFADQHQREKLDQIGDPLLNIAELLDFKALTARVDKAVPRGDRSKGGRPPYPTEVMIRILVIKKLYNLSNDQMEFQLLDRMSFKRFCGLTDSRTIPDATTIWVFENRIGEKGAREIFNGVESQLFAKGFIPRGGQMIDATLVQAPIQRNTREENKQIKRGEIPTDWSDAKRSQKDTDATWTKKHGKSHFGYKLSVNVDNQYKVIRKVVTSTACESDTNHFDGVLDHFNTSRDVYADRGYPSKARSESLEEQGFRDQIQRRGTSTKSLSGVQKKRNHRISKTRARVEHPFATISQMGGKFVRTIGQARANFSMLMMAACYNIKRGVYLVATNGGRGAPI